MGTHAQQGHTRRCPVLVPVLGRLCEMYEYSQRSTYLEHDNGLVRGPMLVRVLRISTSIVLQRSHCTILLLVRVRVPLAMRRAGGPGYSYRISWPPPELGCLPVGGPRTFGRISRLLMGADAGTGCLTVTGSVCQSVEVQRERSRVVGKEVRISWTIVIEVGISISFMSICRQAHLTCPSARSCENPTHRPTSFAPLLISGS